MNRNDVFNFLKTYFTNEFEVPENRITLDAGLFDDLELDSIDALDMVGMLEAKLDIETDEKELKHIVTVQDVVDYIMVKTSNSQYVNFNSQAAV